MGESRNAYRVLVGRPEGKRPLGRPRRRWEDNIKMDLREVGYDDRDWINLAQDRGRWRAYVRAAMNLRDDGEEYISPAIDDNSPDEDEVSSAEVDSNGVRMMMKAGCPFHTRSTIKTHRGEYIAPSGMTWRTETPAQSKLPAHNTVTFLSGPSWGIGTATLRGVWDLFISQCILDETVRYINLEAKRFYLLKEIKWQELSLDVMDSEKTQRQIITTRELPINSTGIEYTKKQSIILTGEDSINFRGNEETQEQVIITTRGDPINSTVKKETQGQDNDKRRSNKLYKKVRE
ncbi:hypothetical protein ANN_19460 [Periplaneta americana]|uniref:Uncharacterized protein n=1 Tax=Periplaneta americana TaxID=6978 RepID=A0ABQ8S9Z8_PERAM|nr:hypothetical protein ANN_19460 [Periplaneta americana]